MGSLFPYFLVVRKCHANVFVLPIEVEKNRLVLDLVLNLIHGIVFLFSFFGKCVNLTTYYISDFLASFF